MLNHHQICDMGCVFEPRNKPHVVFVPFPAQGHINPMLKLAKILYQKGFHVTFVYTELIYRRLIKSRGPDSLKGLPSFRFETIADGLSSTDDEFPNNSSNAFPTDAVCLAPFRELLAKLNDPVSSQVPPVSFIIADVVMGFTVEAAEELEIPEYMLWVYNACSSVVLMNHVTLVDKGYIPLKDESYMTNGHLDTVIEDIPNINGMRLRDLPRHNVVNASPKEEVLKFAIPLNARAHRATGFLVNTFEDLESDALKALSSIQPSTFAIGPLNLLMDRIVGDDEDLKSLGSNLWKEEDECLEWLNSKDPNSVMYVSFGSTALVTSDQIMEIAWGLANSENAFLLIVKDDLFPPPEFLESTKDRGMVANWCPQEKVLEHRSVGGFLTHSGWNSVLESISNGVPLICWPSYADQYTVCWSCCNQWGIGMELHDVDRDEVESLVRELINGEKGKEMKKRAVEWKIRAHCSVENSSLLNLHKVLNQFL